MLVERAAASDKEDYVMFTGGVNDALGIFDHMINDDGHIRKLAWDVAVVSAHAETPLLSECVNGMVLDTMISASYAHRAHCPRQNVHDAVR